MVEERDHTHPTQWPHPSVRMTECSEQCSGTKYQFFNLSQALKPNKHRGLEHPHLLLQLDVKLGSQGFLKLRLNFFVLKPCLGWVGLSLLEFSKIMLQNIRVEDVEVRQIKFQQHPKVCLRYSKRLQLFVP